jgi:transcriptional regulator with XRE-family HTH domain
MNYLKKLRLDAGLTQKQVSDAVKLSSPQFVYSWEMKKNIYPSKAMIKKIAPLYGVKCKDIATYIVEGKQKRIADTYKDLLK